LTSWLPNDGLRYGLTIMRLCYLADPTSSHTVKWLSYFLRRGDEVHLLGWSHPTDPLLKGVIYHHLPDVLPTVFVAPARSLLWRLGAWPLAQWRQMQVLLEQIQPDIFDILMLNAGEIPAALARRGPLVITPWGSDLLVYPQKYALLGRWFLRRALHRADLVLCNSAALGAGQHCLGCTTRTRPPRRPPRRRCRRSSWALRRPWRWFPSLSSGSL
jgi:hypothetical protein